LKIISFTRTADALLNGRKTVTRRKWKDSHAQRFKKGDLIAAYDQQPRIKGKKIATLRITCDPYKEQTCFTPDSDWEEEGFAYMEHNGLLIGKDMSCTQLWKAWRENPTLEMWVIRFELVSVEGNKPAS
jgi:hypothetical protein